MTSPKSGAMEITVRRPSNAFFFSTESGNRIGGNDMFDLQASQALGSVFGKDGVDKSQVHVARAVLLCDVHSLRDGAASIHFIVHDDDVAVLDITDQGQRLGLGVVTQTALLDEGDGHVHLSRIVASFFGKAQVDGNHHGVLHFGRGCVY